MSVYTRVEGCNSNNNSFFIFNYVYYIELMKNECYIMFVMF